MYTSLLAIALTGSLLASSQGEGLAWQTDYAKARELGKNANRPLAVFVGSGNGGQEKVCQDGKLSADAQKELMNNYICLYVDVSTPAGQQLASNFGISKGLGLVLSDRTGGLQAFSHDGDLSAADMNRWLAFASNPSVSVTATLSNSGTRISSYPPGSSMATGSSGYMMMGSYGTFYSGGGMMMGGCPGGNCFRR